MNEFISKTVINGNGCYFVIDAKEKDLLLQRHANGEIVIAYGVTLTNVLCVTRCYWQNVRYFGRDLRAAVDAWEVKNDK